MKIDRIIQILKGKDFEVEPGNFVQVIYGLSEKGHLYELIDGKWDWMASSPAADPMDE